MASEDLKTELQELLENAESLKTLNTIKRAELIKKLLSLPDLAAKKAIEQLKDEQNKLAQVDSKISDLNFKVKSEARALRALMLKNHRQIEAAAANKQSETILRELKQENAPVKSGKNSRVFLRLLFLLLALAAVILLLKNYNYF